MDHTIRTACVSATIDSTGAQLVSLQDGKGRERIWQKDPAIWPKSSPVLFPIVGRLREGKTEIEGKTYQMDCHGFAARSAFEVCENGDNAVRFVLRSNPQTLEQYPYQFEFKVGYTLTDSGLTVRYDVRNTDSRPIRFGVGGHPGFNCPLVEGERFEDYEIEFEHPESLPSPGFQDGIICYAQAKDVLAGRKVLPLDYDLFAQDALVLEGLKSRWAVLRSRKSGEGLRFDFQDYGTVAFWSPPNKHAPFICFEPWFGMGARDDETGEFAGKKGLITLPEGETFTASYTVTFL